MKICWMGNNGETKDDREGTYIVIVKRRKSPKMHRGEWSVDDVNLLPDRDKQAPYCPE
jgi:hypothetical protein